MRIAALFGLSLLLTACGDNVVGGGNTPDASTVAPDYPAGPYGVTMGAVLENMSFSGYVNQGPDDGLVSATGFEELSLADMRKLGYRYVLINVAAEWCEPCQEEALSLPTDFVRWAPRGGYVMSVMTEDKDRAPASRAALDRWVESFKMNYTMLHDPKDEITRVIAPPQLPTNMIVDVEKMEILRIEYGSTLEFFDLFDAILGGGT